MPGAASEDYYALLGVSPDVDDAELRRTWRQLALRWHPDHGGPDTAYIFRKLFDAYAVLSDPIARAAYDRKRPREAAVVREPSPAIRRKAPGRMIRRLSGPFNALLARGVARRAEDDVIELFLDDDEVSEGGHVTISMQVPVSCPMCGPDATEACGRCGSTRTIYDLFAAWLAIPPGVAEGTILTPSAKLPGMVRPVTFRVRCPQQPPPAH
jgi:DnaJ-class molecular chaperone